MPNFAKKLKFETMRTIDSSTFTGSYQALGTPLTYPSRFMLLVNDSNTIVTVSVDGTNAAFVLLPGASADFDMTSNAVAGASLSLPAKTQIYVSGSASSGLVYLTTAYAE